MNERLFTTKEAAAALTLTKATLEAWRCRGDGPAFLRLGRAVRYRQEDLQRFINASLTNSTSEQRAAAATR